jgi:hypothetical protein
MVHRYVWYNGHGLTVRVSFMVSVCRGALDPMVLGPMMQPFPMDDHYTTDVISGVGHPRSDSIVPLVLHTVRCAMAGALTLYYRSLGTASTMLRRIIFRVDHIVELLLLLMIISIYYIIYISSA